MWRFMTLLTVVAVMVAVAVAQDAALSDESVNYRSEIVRDSLDNPAGLVVREGPVGTGPHELFIAESGAGRIIRISTAQPEKIHEVITGFAVDFFGREPGARVGPLGMALLTRTKLVVGGGGREVGMNVVGVYALPISGSSITAEQTDHTVGPLSAGSRNQAAHDQFLGLVKTEESLFVVASSDGPAGWILKSGIAANRLTFLQRFIATHKSTTGGAPTCLAIIPKPRPAFLVVGQMGSKEIAGDSSITFFVPATGAMAMSLGTGLNDISALAYSPAGNLYAADISWSDEQAGGVYRLDDARLEGRLACQAVKIASVTRPTALAFAPDGTLYVTAFGAAENDKQGVLLKITGNF